MLSNIAVALQQAVRALWEAHVALCLMDMYVVIGHNNLMMKLTACASWKLVVLSSSGQTSPDAALICSVLINS